MDFNQASPSYEVAMEISKGKEKAIRIPHLWLLSTSPMAKMDWPTQPLKYPASGKVLFGTERLSSGRTWARLWLGNGKRIRFWDDVWPCHSPQRCMLEFWKIHTVFMTSKWSTLWNMRETKILSLPIQLPIQEHLASEDFFFYSINKYSLPALRIISFGSSILRVIMNKMLQKKRKIFRWSREPPFEVDDEMQMYYFNASLKQEMESVVFHSSFFHEI